MKIGIDCIQCVNFNMVVFDCTNCKDSWIGDNCECLVFDCGVWVMVYGCGFCDSYCCDL